MTYGVKSKLYKRYIKEFPTYAEARLFALKQRQVWTNATMQIYEVDGLQSDKLVEELPPTKPTNYTKIRKKDIRPTHGTYRVNIDPKKIYVPPKDDEFYGESEAEAGLRVEKEMSIYGMPIKTTDTLSWWEKLLWWLTPSKTFVSVDPGVPDGDHTVVMRFKKRKGKIFIVDIK